MITLNSAQLNSPMRIALVGNPNVGKSTLYNLLTKENQHTGNWSGKTVDIARSHFIHRNKQIEITDLPGTYSLCSDSSEEQVTSDFISDSDYDAIIIIVNSTTLHRSLLLTLQILSQTQKAVLCLNMTDEAEKLGLTIDSEELELQLGIPIVKITATKSRNIDNLITTTKDVAEGKRKTYQLQKLKELNHKFINPAERTDALNSIADEIIKLTVKSNNSSYSKFNAKADRILTSKLFGIPVLLLTFGFIFWITAFGANYPSELLYRLFMSITDEAKTLLLQINVPEIIVKLFTDGILTTVSWVVSVMLPPSAIFFVLFALLEESGYLPRIAFILDGFFKPAGTSGKHALTMLMGFGCNACGVMGCRINRTEKERIIATITNSFVPCNGRLPTLIAISSLYFANKLPSRIKPIAVACILLLSLILATIVTLTVSFIMSKTIFKKSDATFILELPNYRLPQVFKIIRNTFKEKVFYVLSRAVYVSIPTGIILWLLTNCQIGSTPVIKYVTDALEPIGNTIGLDGVIITAFILSFPANEIVIPTILMSYTGSGTLQDYSSLSQLGAILAANGWVFVTALCFCIFTLFHFPCSTTCFAIHRETKSIKWTLVSIIIPLTIGFVLCFLTKMIFI